ncbi:MAG: hypothetical protein AVDCRST_MAG86-4151 [uncultured Truepera sp.]|uniref:Uncharacterized protein n=1 Tax=uncultured Truepera sp. TaxID=543023 RepID=A0A6J4VYT2_9DEIN|nr:MAG: hypothetical protein AVDCRST_MAG86-4151 [uncultured Truepera sp.]
MTSSSLNPKSARPNLTFNPFLVTATLIWLAATLYLLFFADLTNLRYGNQEPATYLLGQVGVLPFIALMLFLARRTGLKPVDHTSELGLSRTSAALETAWLLAYMFATMGLGMALNIHNHIHFGAFADGTQSVLGQEPRVSSILWAGYNLLVYVVLPLAFFSGMRRYSAKELLLSFPKPRVFVPFAVLAGVVGVVPFITSDFWSTPLLGHLLTLLIYSLGTLIPVAVFTQALLAPRLAFLARSWVTGAVLAGVVYMLFNLNEYFVEWGSAPEVGLSLTWLLAGDLFWGTIKAVSTLALGNAWMHIFTTHTLHLADAPLVAKVFGIR